MSNSTRLSDRLAVAGSIAAIVAGLGTLAGSGLAAADHLDGLESTVRITTPGGPGCAAVPRDGTQVAGEADLRDGDRLWILVRAPEAGAYFFNHHEALTVSDGRWSTYVPYLGGDGDQGEQLELLAVTGDSDVANRLTELQRSGGFTELPDGATARATACVERVT